MQHAVRLLLGLAGLTAAGAALAHTGVYPHSHPHLDLDLLIIAVLGGIVGALLAWFTNRPPKQ